MLTGKKEDVGRGGVFATSEGTTCVFSIYKRRMRVLGGRSIAPTPMAQHAHVRTCGCATLRCPYLHLC